MNETAQINCCSSGSCHKKRDGLTACAGSCCDIGNFRNSNDDLVFASNGCRLYVALDGVGGNAGGAQASQIVLEQIRAKIRSMCFAEVGETREDIEVAVARALRLAALDMIRVGNENPDHRRMGTVFALAFVVDRTLFYTSVGDSRVYLLRGGRLQQLTKDESYVQALVDAGAITTEDARHHPMRNIITNSVSGRFMSEYPVVRKHDLTDGDTLLLTTDGVTDKLLPIEIQNLLNEHEDPMIASERIVELAIEEGSHDNCSCIVVRIQANSDQLISSAKSGWLRWPWKPEQKHGRLLK